MRIDVSNRQTSMGVDTRKVRALLRVLMQRAALLDPETEWLEISALLTDDEGIRRLNEAHLDRPDTTDVLSFLYNPMPGDDEKWSGELVVNVQRAMAEGARTDGRRRRPWGPSLELALYLAHGIDHLTGATDTTGSDRRRMRRRELRWLGQSEAMSLATALVAFA